MSRFSLPVSPLSLATSRLRQRNEEIVRLRADLSRARSEGYAAGIEAAAKKLEDEATWSVWLGIPLASSRKVIADVLRCSTPNPYAPMTTGEEGKTP